MGATNGRDGAAGVETRSRQEPISDAPSGAHRRDSEVSASGVREQSDHARDASQRETTPAPPHSSEEWAANLPSARPTSVPDFDMAALALETSLRQQPLRSLPLDIAVPARTRSQPPPGLELRAAFLLLHADGRASVHDIAEQTALPVGEVIAAFVELAHMGLVELPGASVPSRAVPVSGEHEKAVVPADEASRGALDGAALGPDDETLR